MVENDRDNKTRLSYWFPKLVAAGLPVPRTRFRKAQPRVQAAILDILDGRDPHPDDLLDFEAFLTSLQDVTKELGVPMFLRTDLTSGKHNWVNTCYVADPEFMGRHVLELAFSCVNADMIGLPFDTYVAREFLPILPYGTAYHGMPVNKEFRFFVQDGNVLGYQPYWPEEALEAGANEDSSIDYEALTSFEGDDWLHLYLLAQKASLAVPGYWSVDMLETKVGWYITDMAEGERSYKDPEGYREQ